MDAVSSSDRPGAAALLREALIDDPPKYVGGYEILEEIAQGGMGIVYKARSLHGGPTVALKMIRPGVFWEEGAVRLFKREVQATTAAQHPHIVPINHVDEHEGQLYYTMPLCRGSLASVCEERTPKRIGLLIQQVARGVQRAHELGFLHLDLKPANVLIDDEGKPRVADFGLARLAAAGSGSPTEPRNPGSTLTRAPLWGGGSRTTAGGGTPPYSAPEQESGEEPVTTASDIYSVGAILFELLTLRTPDALTLATEPSRGQVSFLHPLRRDLLAIACKCMASKAELRYRSAAELAEDIGLALRYEAPVAGSSGVRQRLLRLSFRRPALAILSVLAPAMVAGCILTVRDWTQEQVKNVLLANGLAAKFAAGWILTELTDRMGEVERIATDPRVVALSVGPLTHNAEALRAYQRRGFGLVAVYNRDGVVTALWPEGPANVVGLDYAWRDYFRGACREGKGQVPGAYLSRAFQSENDGDYNLSISTPIVQNGECVGLVLASILTDVSLGPVRLVGQDNPRHKGVLVGPQDRRRGDPDGAFPRDYLILIHDALRPAQGVSLWGDVELAKLRERFGGPRPRGQQLALPDVAPLTTERYLDPLDTEHRWLAAFYPVGGTGLVVGVQTRYDLIDRLGDVALVTLGWVLAAVGAGAALRLLVRNAQATASPESEALDRKESPRRGAPGV
jgi:eukaryotic-like serine/threonine-protein kinase